MSTFTYDMVKTLRAQGATLTVEQLDLAIASVVAEIETDAKALQAFVESIKPKLDGKALAALVVQAGKAGGSVHSTEKSPFPKDQKAETLVEETHEKIGEALNGIMADSKGMKHKIAKVLDHERHLSKLTSWRERLLMGLDITPSKPMIPEAEADESPDEGGLADTGDDEGETGEE